MLCGSHPTFWSLHHGRYEKMDEPARCLCAMIAAASRAAVDGTPMAADGALTFFGAVRGAPVSEASWVAQGVEGRLPT